MLFVPQFDRPLERVLLFQHCFDLAALPAGQGNLTAMDGLCPASVRYDRQRIPFRLFFENASAASAVCPENPAR